MKFVAVTFAALAIVGFVGGSIGVGLFASVYCVFTLSAERKLNAQIKD